MTRHILLRQRVATTVVTAVVASALVGVGAAPAAAAAAPAPTHGSTVDYFADVYDDLGTGSVFETVTIERFEYLLKDKSGSVAFLIGDPGDASTQATIGHVDAVAKRLGVDRVYTFTPKLDGDTLNVWDLSESGLRELGRTHYATVGDRLLTGYLNKDTETTFTKNAATDPYLFVYDKDRVVGGQEDRIVAALSGAKTAADLDTPAEVSAYEDQVEDVLGAVPADEYAAHSTFTFLKDEVNRRHSATYADPALFGGEILTDADATDGFRVQTLTYPELVHLLQQPGDFPILFGGTWCHNTRAILPFVNGSAQSRGVKTVYNFDFSLLSTSNGGSQYDHIRDKPSEAEEDGVVKVARPSHLYGDLVNTYLPNAVTQYRKTGDPGSTGLNPVTYFPGGDTTKPLAEARKIQVGHLVSYNKDRKDAQGNPAPVVDQAIRQNDDGGNTEHMTEWWFTKGRDLAYGDEALRGNLNPASESGKNQLQSQRAFAKEAVDEIDLLFRGLAGESVASTTSVALAGDAADGTVPLGETPTVDVTVAATGYGPFLSLNTANQDAAPSSTTGKPRGFVEISDGDELLGSARLKRDGTASIALPGLSAGERSLTISYRGRGDIIEPSQATVTLSVVGDPSTTTLAAPASLVYGTGGTATATVTTGATGTVTFTGLPGGPRTATIEDGTAKVALAPSTPAGTYALVAKYGGDSAFGVSQSAPQSIVVTKAATSLTPTVKSGRYGSAASVTLLVKGPAGTTPSGKVTVTAAGTPRTLTLGAGGRATLALPRTLAPKAYAVTAVYLGNGNLKASSRSVSVTVGRGTATKVAFKPTGKLRASKKGKATVTVATPAGLTKAGGTVKIVLKRGSRTRTVVATVRSGKASVKLPKLKAGTWRVTTTYRGDTRYAAARAVVTKVTVRR